MRPVQVAAWLLKQSFLQHIHFQWLHRIWRNRLEHRKYSRTLFNGPLWRVRVCERSVVFVLRENWVRLSRFFAHASPLRVVVKIAWAAFSLVLFKSLKWAPSMVKWSLTHFFLLTFIFYNVLSWRFSIVLSSSWKNSVLLRGAKNFTDLLLIQCFAKQKLINYLPWEMAVHGSTVWYCGNHCLLQEQKWIFITVSLA